MKLYNYVVLNYKPKFNLQIERVNTLLLFALGRYPGWSILGGTLVGPSWGVPWLVHPGRVLFCAVFCDHFWGGVLCDLSHNAVDVTSLLSRHQLMGLAWCTCLYSVAPKHYGKVTWDPPIGQIDRQTLVKTLPSRTTCAGGKYSEAVFRNLRCGYLFHWWKRGAAGALLLKVPILYYFPTGNPGSVAVLSYKPVVQWCGYLSICKSVRWISLHVSISSCSRFGVVSLAV